MHNAYKEGVLSDPSFDGASTCLDRHDCPQIPLSEPFFYQEDCREG